MPPPKIGYCREEQRILQRDVRQNSAVYWLIKYPQLCWRYLILTFLLSFALDEFPNEVRDLTRPNAKVLHMFSLGSILVETAEPFGPVSYL